MNKKLLVLVTLCAVATFICVACSNSSKENKGEDQSSSGDQKSEVSYEKLEDAPVELKTQIEKISKQQGYSILNTEGGDQSEKYIFIGLGEKPSAGYGVDVQSIKTTEDNVIIEVDEIQPAATAKLEKSYPYAIIKLKTDMENIEVINTTGETFKKIETKTDTSESQSSNESGSDSSENNKSDQSQNQSSNNQNSDSKDNSKEKSGQSSNNSESSKDSGDSNE